MGSKVHLFNKYYPWSEIKFNGVKYFLKGNVFLNNKYLGLEKIADSIYPLICSEDRIREKELSEFLDRLNGEFAIVAEAGDRIFCALDKLRGIPLFYSLEGDDFLLSDNAYFLKDNINSCLNEKNAAEFMVAGFVTGDETLFDGIKQIRNGEFLTYQKKDKLLNISSYFRFLHGTYFEESELQLLEMLDHAFVNAFSRLIESTVNQGKKLVIPLSGGLDSRIVIGMLKRLGVKDVTCISYGRKGNRESLISKKVSKALGYNWLFAEYTAEKWHECFTSKEADHFQILAGNLSSLPHMQDFLAIQELKNQGKLPNNSVFVPGHSGDMISGGHIPRHYLDKSGEYNSATLLDDSFKKHYNLWEWPKGSEFENIFKEKINKCTFGLEIKDNESCANAVEFLDFNERQAKYIINSVRVYEFFGYEWRIPLWDLELINFFLKVPLKYRINEDLYKKYARDRLFSGALSMLKKIDCTTDMLDLRPLDERSKYEKLLHYRTFIHSYYDEKINNPEWGRFFENPLISRLQMKVARYENKAVEEYPLLKNIIDYRNEKMYPLSRNGLSTLIYLARSIEDNKNPKLGTNYSSS